MPKQLRLQEFMGDGCCIDGHKGLAGSRAVSMQGPRHQLFARTRLAIDQNGDARAAQSANGPEHLLHGRSLADEDGVCLIPKDLGLHVLGLVVAMGIGAPGEIHRLIDVEGLG
jgi:hypothetical protein